MIETYITNWQIISQKNPYSGETKYKLQGQIQNDVKKRFENGTEIISSTIKSIVDCEKMQTDKNNEVKIYDLSK